MLVIMSSRAFRAAVGMLLSRTSLGQQKVYSLDIENKIFKIVVGLFDVVGTRVL